MEIVNGYLCMNSCDAKKARAGQNPHQQTNEIQKQLNQPLDNPASAGFGPAATFGGSLRAPTDSGPVTAGSSSQTVALTQGPAASSGIDIIA
jgi:hypothetical protein